MGGHGKAIEAAKTVLEVADMAWKAVELSHHHLDVHEKHLHHHDHSRVIDDELEALRMENTRLRGLLEENLKLLQSLSESPLLMEDCPPHLHSRLLTTVESENFVNQLTFLEVPSADKASPHFPFKDATEIDIQSAEILVNVDREEPSWWVWVSEDMVPNAIEEKSAIDNESYIVVTEDHVVDAVANFIARCVIAHPKARKLPPKLLQKTLTNALNDVSKLEKMMNIWHAGKLFYALATWGLALTGLYRTRAVIKFAAMGVHSTSKMILKAL